MFVGMRLYGGWLLLPDRAFLNDWCLSEWWLLSTQWEVGAVSQAGCTSSLPQHLKPALTFTVVCRRKLLDGDSLGDCDELQEDYLCLLWSSSSQEVWWQWWQDTGPTLALVHYTCYGMHCSVRGDTCPLTTPCTGSLAGHWYLHNSSTERSCNVSIMGSLSLHWAPVSVGVWRLSLVTGRHSALSSVHWHRHQPGVTTSARWWVSHAGNNFRHGRYQDKEGGRGSWDAPGCSQVTLVAIISQCTVIMSLNLGHYFHVNWRCMKQNYYTHMNKWTLL